MMLAKGATWTSSPRSSVAATSATSAATCSAPATPAWSPRSSTRSSRTGTRWMTSSSWWSSTLDSPQRPERLPRADAAWFLMRILDLLGYHAAAPHLRRLRRCRCRKQPAWFSPLLGGRALRQRCGATPRRARPSRSTRLKVLRLMAADQRRALRPPAADGGTATRDRGGARSAARISPGPPAQEPGVHPEHSP